MESIDEKNLKYLEFLNRENNVRHHRYDEEMLQYSYLRDGNMQAIPESVAMLSSSLPGHTSDNSLRNIKYLFVASITLATRYAIEGGMNEEKAYNTSDLFIQKMDLCQSIDTVKLLHKEMFTFFTTQMANLKKENIYSKPVIQCMDYIYYHLNEKITLQTLAQNVSLNPKYLSMLFVKESGMTISDYIKSNRITASKNMLRYSEYSYAEISAILAYSSQSHFTKVFRSETGYTPKEYRQKFYRAGYWKNNGSILNTE